jgi:hypothetical protein
MDVVPTIAKVLGAHTDFRFDGLPVDAPHTATLLQQRNGREAKLVARTPQQFAQAFDADLRAQDQRFPPGPVADVGPRPDLIGRPAADLATAPAAGGATIANADSYRDVHGRTVPAYVTGTTSGVPAGTDLIVAVNGTIEASGEAYDTPDGPRYSVLIPPDSLKPGANRIQVLSVTGETATELTASG